MIGRAVCVALALVAIGTSPHQARAQLNPGIHVARATDSFGGTNGVGASIQLSFPLFPIDVFVAGDYFFPDCGSADKCSFLGGSADLHVKLPVSLLTPYATGGLVYRRTNPGGGRDVVAKTGYGVGVGVHLGALVLGAYGELRYEVVDPDNQIVFRVGIHF